MKKIIAALLIGLGAAGLGKVQAQFGDFGVRVGMGAATISDDLSTLSPIFGATIGGYVNYTFSNTESVAAELLYIQTGLNINRRGSNFREVLENDNTMSVRRGYYHAYYAQIPILLNMKFELPVRQEGHVVGLFAGPALSVGLFGRCKDRMVSPGNPAYTANYDLDINGTAAQRAVFSHLRRIDVDAIVGLSYTRGALQLSIYMDHGFVATSMEPDILRIITQSMSGSSNIRTEIPNGNNTAYMIGLSYKLGTF